MPDTRTLADVFPSIRSKLEEKTFTDLSTGSHPEGLEVLDPKYDKLRALFEMKIRCKNPDHGKLAPGTMLGTYIEHSAECYIGGVHYWQDAPKWALWGCLSGWAEEQFHLYPTLPKWLEHLCDALSSILDIKDNHHNPDGFALGALDAALEEGE